METRQTIITSFLTTLATIFVVAVIMHMCGGHCGGKSSCSKQKSHCERSMSYGSDSSCKEKCCADKSKCDMEKSCSKDGKMCKMEGKTCTMKDGKEMVMDKEIVIKEVKK